MKSMDKRTNEILKDKTQKQNMKEINTTKQVIKTIKREISSNTTPKNI